MIRSAGSVTLPVIIFLTDVRKEEKQGNLPER
jgi:hypothetical protein